MEKFYRIIKNKYFIASFFTLMYILLLHDTDLATLNARKKRVNLLEQEIVRKKIEINDLKISLNELSNIESLEKFGREKYFFKKENEDLFVLSEK